MFAFLFLVLFEFVFSVSLPGDDVLFWLFFLSVSFCLLSLHFFSDRVPGLGWFGSVYLETTAGFIADQFMEDKQQQSKHYSKKQDKSINNFLAYDILGKASAFSRYYDNLIDNTNDSCRLRIYTEILNLPILSTFWMKLYGVPLSSWI